MLRSAASCAGMPVHPVSAFERFSNTVFGSPSLRRANGGFKAHFFSKLGRKRKRKVPKSLPGQKHPKECMRHRSSERDAVSSCELANKVFQIDEQTVAGNEALPRIWLTERAPDDVSANASEVRPYIASYPNGEDAGGIKALELAERMLGEGFANNDAPVHQRKRFFQAAEILLLHAVDKGNTAAAMRLADIYRFDLCKGGYWSSALERRARHAQAVGERELLRRAWVLYAMAARAGDASAHMGLGDLEMSADDEGAHRRAFARYCRSYRMMLDEVRERQCASAGGDRAFARASLRNEEIRSFGSIMLRLAKCFERALGCTRNITLAKKLYECSKMNLEEAYLSGCWHDKSECIAASRGYARCVQESRP